MTTATATAPAPARTHRPRREIGWIAAALAAQVGLVGVAVAPQLSARVTGQEYRLRVAPVDPIDPFRGAYVALSYPGVAQTAPSRMPSSGTAYIPLGPDPATPGLMKGGPAQSAPPAEPYLRCDTDGGRLSCGIESWFVPQDRAATIESQVRGGHAVSIVRIDGRGNAAVTDLRVDTP